LIENKLRKVQNHQFFKSRLGKIEKKAILAILDWTGLDWTGLDWTGLDWTGLDWTGLDWTGLDWIGLAGNTAK
jgi:hypothetical protein